MVLPLLLKKVDSEDVLALISIKNNEGKAIFDYSFKQYYYNFEQSTPFSSIIPLLDILKLEDLITYFSEKNAAGQNILYTPEIFSEVLLLLNKLPGDSLNQLFSVQDINGNTILHNPLIFEKAASLFDQLDPEVFQIRNNDGFTPEEWSQIKLSLGWLVKNKIAIDSKPITEEEYGEKAKELKQDLDALWDSFVFGGDENEVPLEYLSLGISGAYTKEGIKNALDAILAKIINKTPWLGTPPAEDKNGLHLFYTQMLINFAQVASILKQEKLPSKKAGTIIGIAKVEIEGRCAAAYQSEIEQAKMLLDSDAEVLGLEGNFNKLACASLTGSIEDIVRRDAKGDSHAFTQLLYSVGLAISADPLAQITVENCQKMIIADWTKEKLVGGLTEMIGRIDREQLQDWFRAMTPDDFGKDFRFKQSEVERAEKKVIDVVKVHLREQGIDEVLTESALAIFQSTQGAALGLSSRPRKFLSDAVFDMLNFATTLDQVKEAQILLSKENQDDRLKRIALLEKEDILKERSAETLSVDERALLDSIVQQKKAFQQKSIGIEGELNAFKLNAETRIKLGELLKVQNPLISRRELDIIIAEKKIFDDAIRALAEEKEIDFSPSETGLPSRGVEYQRRVEYASQFFTANEEAIKLNKRGTVELLVHIGVLESVALMHI